MVKMTDYDLPVYRFRELKYFCLQYYDMKAAIEQLKHISHCASLDPTADIAVPLADYERATALIETTARGCSATHGDTILKMVATGTRDNEVPEILLRRFYWLLDKVKGI